MAYRMGVAECYIFAHAADRAWCTAGEKFLSLTDRSPAEILIVEGWIRDDGIRAAKLEFESGKYKYIVTSGSVIESHGIPQNWNYAIEAHDFCFVQDASRKGTCRRSARSKNLCASARGADGFG
jgi:hypothetical protein